MFPAESGRLGRPTVTTPARAGARATERTFDGGTDYATDYATCGPPW
jgi:hypothetical protein